MHQKCPIISFLPARRLGGNRRSYVHSLPRDGEVSLLLRKNTSTVSCSALAWPSAGPLTASLVYSLKYLLLRKVATREELIYIMIALSQLTAACVDGGNVLSSHLQSDLRADAPLIDDPARVYVRLSDSSILPLNLLFTCATADLTQGILNKVLVV